MRIAPTAGMHRGDVEDPRADVALSEVPVGLHRAVEGGAHAVRWVLDDEHQGPYMMKKMHSAGSTSASKPRASARSA